MDKLKIAVLNLALPGCILNSGCSTAGKSAAAGFGIGAGTGAIIGGIADPGHDGEYRTRNIVIGSALGGIFGAATGNAIFSKVQKEKALAQKAALEEKPTKPEAAPGLNQAKIESRWVESKILGNRYISAHWEYQIIEPAKWKEDK